MTIKTHNSKSIKDFLKLGGTSRDAEIAKVQASKYTLNDDILNIVEMYYTLIANTNYFQQEVYSFYVEGLTYQEISEKHDVNINYLRTLIYNENNRLFNDLGGYDIYYMLSENKFTKLTIKIINLILFKLLNDREDIVYRENTIKIGKGDVEDNKEIFLNNLVSVQPENIEYDRQFFSTIDDNNFTHLINLVKSISINNQQQFINKINPKFIGYLNFIYNSPVNNLTYIDNERKKVLHKILGG